MKDDFDDLFSKQPSDSDSNRTEGFNTLSLTRFIPPNGRKQQEEISGLPDDLYKKYLEIEVGLNCRFTIEMLRTGVTSICIENPECGDFSMKLIRDDREENIKNTIETMLKEFDFEKYEEWLQDQ